jgi:hypothetical protein
MALFERRAGAFRLLSAEVGAARLDRPRCAALTGGAFLVRRVRK